MYTVYALSAKGLQERRNQPPTLPAELSELLRLVDGCRTNADLLAAARGKSAVVAGGLRWLKASGYILVTELPARADTGARSTAAAVVPARHAASPSVRPPFSQPASAPAPEPADSGRSTLSRPQSTLQAPVRAENDVCRILADFMIQSIRRRLGEGGYAYRRQIERAASVQQLLPHLNPLIDAIVAKVGADAGAEFADTAAFILRPRDRDTTLS